MINSKVDFPILVCSCEKTKFIAKHMLISLDKYVSIKIHIFIGVEINICFSNLELEYIETEKSDWKTETMFQINYIKKKTNSSNFLIILDDFIFRKRLDFHLVESLFQIMPKHGIKHLLLKPIDDSIFQKMFELFLIKHFFNNIKYKKIRLSHPYFSSLQLAIWDFDHFSTILNKSNSIWDFERQKDDFIDHFCLAFPIVHYKHVVEKGEWDYFAKNYCLKHISYFEKSNIDFKKMNYLKFIFNFIKKNIYFPLFGYLLSRNV